MDESVPKSNRFLSRLFSGQKNEEIEDEIISMVNEGHEQGVLEASEAQMITNIFNFSDKEAKDIMTHRSNMIAIEGSATLKDTVTFMLNSQYSRYPVYIDNIDRIIGILHVKDACKILYEGNGKYDNKPISSLKSLIWEARFVHETRKLDTLFASMQSSKIHMVIVVDEYGQTSGIIAMEDILEEIVGNIEDEYDKEEGLILQKGENAYEIDGLTPLDELEGILKIQFEKDEYGTLNGLMTSMLERIPGEDDLFDIDYRGYNFKVLSVENKVIKKVLVTKIEEKQ